MSKHIGPPVRLDRWVVVFDATSGPVVVKTDQERIDLEMRARQVSGVTKVDNQIEVKP